MRWVGSTGGICDVVRSLGEGVESAPNTIWRGVTRGSRMDEKTKQWMRTQYKSVLAVDEALFEAILANLELLMSVGSKARASEFVDVLSESSNQAEPVIRATVGWVTTAAYLAVSSGEADAREDLLPLVAADDRKEFEPKLERIFAVALEKQDRLRLAMQRSVSVKGLLPFFDEINATVELRALFESNIGHLGHLGREDKIGGLEPIASIRIVLDSGFPPDLTFQVGKDGLDSMIKSLVELRGRMEEIAEFAIGASK